MSFTQNEENMLHKVTARIKERKDSLEPFLELTKGKGIEAWLKVEAVKALGLQVVKDVKNKGPDLIIQFSNEPESKIELKAHNGDTFQIPRYPKFTCLFLMHRGKNFDKNRQRVLNKGFIVKTDDIDSHWIIGLLKLPNS